MIVQVAKRIANIRFDYVGRDVVPDVSHRLWQINLYSPSRHLVTA